ncbi:MAG TPA: ribosome recycling factor [Candidatus Paceibacterota bacterium]
MNYDFKSLEAKGGEMKLWLVNEFGVLRTGRATPAILDSILVDSYGVKTPLKHVASISIDDPKTLRVTPWDASILKSIETAISLSNIGVQPIADKNSVRIRLPDLTEERRKMLLKVVSEKLEDAKVSLRKERDEVWKNIQEGEKEGKISEDDKFRFKDELQKIIDKLTAELHDLSEKKKLEIGN